MQAKQLDIQALQQNIEAAHARTAQQQQAAIHATAQLQVLLQFNYFPVNTFAWSDLISEN